MLSIKPTIAHKARLLIFALGRMSGLADWYCLHAIDTIDEADSLVTEHIAPARLALSEAKGALTAFGLGVYKMSASDPPATTGRVGPGRRRARSLVVCGIFRAVMLGVMLGGLVGVVRGMQAVGIGDMGVVPGFFGLAARVALGGFAVMVSRVLVVVGRRLVVLAAGVGFCAHGRVLG